MVEMQKCRGWIELVARVLKRYRFGFRSTTNFPLPKKRSNGIGRPIRDCCFFATRDTMMDRVTNYVTLNVYLN